MIDPTPAPPSPLAAAIDRLVPALALADEPSSFALALDAAAPPEGDGAGAAS
jgi:hypothetical protein